MNAADEDSADPTRSAPSAGREIDTMRTLRVIAVAGAVFLIVGVVLHTIFVTTDVDGVPALVMRVTGRLLHADGEANLWVWTSSAALAMVAGGLTAHAIALRTTERRAARAYGLLAVIILVMSIDEGAQLHEMLDPATQVLRVGLNFTWNWLALGIPLAIVAGVLALLIARDIDRTLRNRLIVAGTVFLTGAMGFELIGGMVRPGDETTATATDVLRYQLVMTCEEGFEFAGILLALRAMLRSIAVTATTTGIAARSRLAPTP